ncbi:unnamed protein product [Oikopleura dioica]|uniref:Large ribosomal subunit protein mL44 dsRNA binding domain-containing protein n=1 Tax=Oikopleura dioica TaxID=34765 RepID=E4YEL5_OIKDI|nr:unnamed protein product [Oikopleura dioica]
MLANLARSTRRYRPNLYYKNDENKLASPVRIEDHPKWGWKRQRTNKAHAEYQLRKSLLEKDDLKRWEYLDWNLEQEITTFGHRIQCEMDQYKFSQLLNGDHNPEYVISVLKKIIDEKICISDASEQISRSLASHKMLDSAARSVGFHNLVPNYEPEAFGIFLSNLKDDTVIENLLTPAYLTAHNILTFIPDAWNSPLEYYEKHIGLIEPRLVKTVGENSALPTYVVAVFDEEKKMLAYSVGESPQLASEDACRVALQKHLQKA